MIKYILFIYIENDKHLIFTYVLHRPYKYSTKCFKMNKDFRLSKYKKNKKPNQYMAHDAAGGCMDMKKTTAEIKQMRHVLKRYIDDCRFLDKKETYVLWVVHAKNLWRNGYSEGLCACEGYDENGKAICPHAGLSIIYNQSGYY